jgi:hypothetical protein
MVNEEIESVELNVTIGALMLQAIKATVAVVVVDHNEFFVQCK